MDPTTRCEGVVIVHLVHEVTCTDPTCTTPLRGPGVFDHHNWFVSCAEALGSRCPRCAPAPVAVS